jgi:hypothetical protein
VVLCTTGNDDTLWTQPSVRESRYGRRFEVSVDSYSAGEARTATVPELPHVTSDLGRATFQTKRGSCHPPTTLTQPHVKRLVSERRLSFSLIRRRPGANTATPRQRSRPSRPYVDRRSQISKHATRDDTDVPVQVPATVYLRPSTLAELARRLKFRVRRSRWLSLAGSRGTSMDAS